MLIRRTTTSNSTLVALNFVRWPSWRRVDVAEPPLTSWWWVRKYLMNDDVA
jgi:hypothetical protein